MKITTETPVKRTFTITLDEDELAVIYHAMVDDDGGISKGDAKNYDLFNEMESFMSDNDVDTVN